MLFTDPPLTLREFMTHEPTPLAAVFREVALFLVDRGDAVVFGAHAVNAYCAPERMTQDVDILSTNAGELVEKLRTHLGSSVHIAVRVREVTPGGFRLYQIREPKNRHLVDVRQVQTLPPWREIEGLRIVEPPHLTALKVLALSSRRGRPKGDTDMADLKRLLLAFPALKAEEGPVAEALRAMSAPELALTTWRELVRSVIEPDIDDDLGASG